MLQATGRTWVEARVAGPLPPRPMGTSNHVFDLSLSRLNPTSKFYNFEPKIQHIVIDQYHPSIISHDKMVLYALVNAHFLITHNTCTYLQMTIK